LARADHQIEEQRKESTIKAITWGNLTWVDIVPPTEEATQYLAEHYKFHPLALDDCLSRKQLPKVDVYPGYLFMVFHFPLYNRETRTSAQRQWSVFLGDDFLVTIHTGELRTLVALFRDCQLNEESRQEYFSNGSGYLLYRILDRSVDSYFPVLDKILSLMEEVEDSVFDEDVEAATELSILRRDIIAQRRVMFPTRMVLMELQNKLKRFSKTDVSAYYDDLMDHINKICETLDECKEIIEVFKDADFTLATHRINRVVRILNIFATIILPFLVISSIYGMNISLPGGLERGELRTFIILFVAMVLIAGGMLYYFRRRRWI
jgi:magnesium transporter